MDCNTSGFQFFHYFSGFPQTAWKIPWMEEPGRRQSTRSQRVRHDWVTSLHVSIESVMPSNHLILCRPLLLLPSIFPSIRVFSSESVLHIRWPKYWSFSFSISPSNEYSGLISFRIDWFDFLAVQVNLKSFLQRHSSNASVLRCSASFMIQLSHPYMTTGKNTALTRWIFVGKVRSLLFNVLPRLVLAFLPRTKCLNFMAEVTTCSDFAAAAAAKSRQSFPTLCDPIDGSPSGSPAPGILQARILEWF